MAVRSAVKIIQYIPVFGHYTIKQLSHGKFCTTSHTTSVQCCDAAHIFESAESTSAANDIAHFKPLPAVGI